MAAEDELLAAVVSSGKGPGHDRQCSCLDESHTLPSTARFALPLTAWQFYWCDHADDLSSAVLYVSEDAYASPLARVKFVNASIHKATVDEFREWPSVSQSRF